MFKQKHMRGTNNMKLKKMSRSQKIQKLMKVMIRIMKQMLMVDSVSQEQFQMKFL